MRIGGSNRGQVFFSRSTLIRDVFLQPIDRAAPDCLIKIFGQPRGPKKTDRFRFLKDESAPRDDAICCSLDQRLRFMLPPFLQVIEESFN